MADNGVIRRKARGAQLIYEDLLERLDMRPIPTTFVADEGRKGMLSRTCFTSNPFPVPLNVVLTKLRIPAVQKLFEDEIIPQTSAIAAVLAACSTAATEIGALRGDDVSGAQIRCDLVFAGLQAVRLYMSDHKHCKEFTRSRVQSAIRVNNALNGSMHKFRARDGRDVSFHVYYQSQQERLVKALGLAKPSSEYGFFTMKKDLKEIAAKVATMDAMELEDLSFDCGACGCMIRSREEWEASEVGKAVIALRQRLAAHLPPDRPEVFRADQVIQLPQKRRPLGGPRKHRQSAAHLLQRPPHGQQLAASVQRHVRQSAGLGQYTGGQISEAQHLRIAAGCGSQRTAQIQLRLMGGVFWHQEDLFPPVSRLGDAAQHRVRFSRSGPSQQNGQHGHIPPLSF